MKQTTPGPMTMRRQETPNLFSARKIVAIVLLGLVLLASLLACGYFGAKTLYRSRQRHAAMAAYAKKDYATAEILLRRYIEKDRNCEPEVVALANIYRSYGNTGYEAQLWQQACSLNPLNAEYRENMLLSAIRSVSYGMLHGLLGRELKAGRTLPDQEMYIYVIASYRSGYRKDGDDVYKKAVEADPEAFHKSDLGRMAEFMFRYSSLSDGEREEFLDFARKSDDPATRFEALYTDLMRVRGGDADSDADEETERILKQIVEANYYTGTPLLIDFYFSKFRFGDVVSVAGPYLKTIDDPDMYLLYAESCVFTGKLDEIKALEQKLRKKPGSLPMMADYCRVLISFMENDDAKLAAAVHQTGKLVSSPLSRFIRLRVALAQDSFSEIVSAAKDVFSSPVFHDLQDRALVACLDYLRKEMDKLDKRDDVSRRAELAKILAGYVDGDPLVTEIVLTDQSNRGLAKESDLLDAVERFPGDLLLLELAVENLILNGKAEQAMTLIEQGRKDVEEDNGRLDLLFMLALDQLERYDEAAEVFRQLVEESDFDLDTLADYFFFCWKHEDEAALSAMADRLGSVSDDALKAFGNFFRAASLLLQDDGEGEKQAEALKLLAQAPGDNPEFVLFAANRMLEADMLDEAEAKYRAILKTYPNPGLVYVNLSSVYQARGESEKALEAARQATAVETESQLPVYVYAQRLAEAGRYEEAVDVLNFPRHAVNYRPEIVELWADCMRNAIRNSLRDEKYVQAEEQCKHLLVIVPDDQFGLDSMEQIREILHPKKDAAQDAAPASAA